MLLPKRASAFWEGHKKSSMVFQKISWEEPEKQKTRSCRAQELSRSCAQWEGGNGECTEPLRIGEIGKGSHKETRGINARCQSSRGDSETALITTSGNPLTGHRQFVPAGTRG